MYKLLFFIPFIFTQVACSQPNPTRMDKPTIIYVFDPMCGWCYGFSKVMDRFVVEYKDSFDFEIISGGMVVGEREGPIGDFADYVLTAYKRAEEYSGIKFGEPYLAQLRTKKLWTSSVTPSIAIETFKTFNPTYSIEFASAVQRAHFLEGKDLRKDDVYIPLIEKYGINTKAFTSKMHTDEMKLAAERGFKQSSDFGVTGFPCVIIHVNGKYYALTRGFTDYESLTKAAQKALHP